MNIIYWQWWIASGLFIVVQMLAPRTPFYFWMGIAAGATGLVAFLAPLLPWDMQAGFFVAITVAGTITWRAYSRRFPNETSVTPFIQRGEIYLDRHFVLDEPIVGGHGTLHVDNATWLIEGEDTPAGVSVCVTDIDKTVLKVTEDPH